MDGDKIINDYFVNFKKGQTYNFYLDPIRYIKSDTWTTKKDWIRVAKECISIDNNILQALEILIVEEHKNYYDLADKILTDWYNNGAYDLEYYHDILVAMPENYEIRKKIVGDYSDYLINSSVHSDTILRASLIRSHDTRFLKIYGNYLEADSHL